MSTKRKNTARPNNGRPSKGLTEGQVLVKGPAEVIDGMKAYAEKQGISVREAWRKAAEMLLTSK